MTLLDRIQFLLDNVMHVKQVTIEYDENQYSIHLKSRTIYFWIEVRNQLFAAARLDVSQEELDDSQYDIVRFLRGEYFYPVDKQNGIPTYEFDFNAMRLEFAMVMRDFAPNGIDYEPVEGDYPPEPDFEG